MKSVKRLAIFVALATGTVAESAGAEGLKGSPASMRAQHAVARKADLTFFRTSAQVRGAAGEVLDTVPGNADYRVNNVSFPYARPEVRGMIERVAAGYRAATGERLVVTSLTRPTSLQPRNAHKLSVHPAGIAVDLRIPATSAARAWLEGALLELERKGVLDVTREKSPPHYHVAVFPAAYRTYAAANPAPVRAGTVDSTMLEPAATPVAVVGTGVVRAAAVAPENGNSMAWAIAGLIGMTLAGGSAARRSVALRPARRRDDV